MTLKNSLENLSAQAQNILPCQERSTETNEHTFIPSSGKNTLPDRQVEFGKTELLI